MKVGFHTFENHHGKKNIGSSRIRCKWLVDKWQDAGPDIGEAEIFKLGQKYDVVVYQKAYWIKHAEEFKGIKILDMCDPDWFFWNYDIKKMIDLCDAVTTSSVKLAEFVIQMTDKPVWCIPDRVNLETIKRRKEHAGPAKNVVWFGYSDNFATLDPVIPVLAKHGLNLIVISNEQYHIKQTMYEGKVEVFNYYWSEATVNADILRGDIVINPRLKGGKWPFKSDNKTVQAWALGMPVATTEEELVSFLDEGVRKLESARVLELVQEEYNVLKSVEETKALIQELANAKADPVGANTEQEK